jgi:F-type H+-transporting ATPase subunit a
MVIENIIIKVQIYFPYIFSLFLLIIVGNLLGMFPYSYTLTSSIIITLYLSLSFFTGVNIIGLIKNKERFVNLFMPEGSPLIIMPILCIIELVSYIARVFSLAIRLFANMMSGHTLLKILTGFA